GDGRLRRAHQLGQLALAEAPALAQGTDLTGQTDRSSGLLIAPATLGAVGPRGLDLIPAALGRHWSSSTVWPCSMHRRMASSARWISRRSRGRLLAKTVSSTMRRPVEMKYVMRICRRPR